MVGEALDGVVRVRINPDKGPAAKALMRQYGVTGYPSFMLVLPGKKPRRMSHSGARRLADSVTRARQWGAAAEVRAGAELVQSRRHDAAVKALTAAVERHPQAADAYYWRGVAYRGKGDVERALADFMRTVKLERGMHRAWDQLTSLSLEITRYAEAAVCASELVTHSRKVGARAWELRARARIGTGELRGAYSDARKACARGNQWSCGLARGLRGR